MQEELGRNAENENRLSAAQRVRDASRLMLVDLEAEGLVPKAPVSWRDKVFDQHCRQEEKPVTSLTKLPPLASLIYPRRTRYGAIMEKIPKPDGYLPKMHFPAWVEWPLHRKLPHIPLDAFVFSRGKLNQPLQRDDFRRDYTTVDPHNTFNFLPAKGYNALHDPATYRYFKRPHVQKILLQQGLITNEAEVVCSQKEVNQYREYLEHFQINSLVTELRSEEDRMEHQNMLEKELRAYLANSGDYRVRKELAIERQKLMLEERERRIKAKIREDYVKAKRNRAELRKQFLEKRREAAKCAAYMKKQREALECSRDTRCMHVAIMEKQARAELMAYIVKMRKELVKSIKQSEMMIARSTFQNKELNERKRIITRLQQEREERQNAYKEKMESNQKQFPLLTEKRKANEHRILAIMRKFLNLWREYVKRRKARRADPNHQSTWDVSGTTVQTVNDLQEISGHEKFDNFILNLINMKRGMATELERQQAEAREQEAEAKEEVADAADDDAAGKNAEK